MPLLKAKGLTEQRLRTSGMGWTVLQPNFYMDLWIPAIVGGPALAGRPVTILGDGLRRHSMVAVCDVAACATAALDHPDLALGRTLLIGGPQPVTWRDVVAAFERVLGHDLEVETIAPGERIPHVPEFVSELAAALASYDSPLDMTELARTHGMAQTTLADFVEGFVAATYRLRVDDRATGSDLPDGAEQVASVEKPVFQKVGASARGPCR